MKNEVDWRVRFQDILQVCQKEFKRTTIIGKKMLNASKSNTKLHESYEELGKLVVREIRENRLECQLPQIKELMDTIDSCEKELEKIEKEVKKIKKLKSEGDSQ